MVLAGQGTISLVSSSVITFSTCLFQHVSPKSHSSSHDDGDCLAHLPLAFHHYKDPSWFYDFERESFSLGERRSSWSKSTIVVGLCNCVISGEFYPKENDPKPYRSRDGKVAARKWPYFDDRVYPYFERIRAAMRAQDLSASVPVAVESSLPKATSDLQVADRLYCLV